MNYSFNYSIARVNLLSHKSILNPICVHESQILSIRLSYICLFVRFCIKTQNSHLKIMQRYTVHITICHCRANPNCLGRLYKFQDRYIAKIVQGQKHDATKRELADARMAQDKLGKIRAKWLLRRTKALIADQLPKKGSSAYGLA